MRILLILALSFFLTSCVNPLLKEYEVAPVDFKDTYDVKSDGQGGFYVNHKSLDTK